MSKQIVIRPSACLALCTPIPESEISDDVVDKWVKLYLENRKKANESGDYVKLC